MIERAHRTLKESLRCLATKFPCWEKALPSALLGMRTAVNDMGVSPALVVYGEQIAVPALLFEEVSWYAGGAVIDLVAGLQSDLRTIRDFLLANDPALMAGDNTLAQAPEYPYRYVYLLDPILRNSLAPKYTGPYKVHYVRFRVITIDKDGDHKSVSVDRLRPAY